VASVKTVHSLSITADFIPGRGGATAHETRSSEELAKRVASLPEENSEGTARELIALLLAFNRSGRPRRRDIRTLEVVRGRAEAILPGLQARLNSASTPLTRVTRENAHVVEKLLKELGAAYTRLVLAPAPLISFGVKEQLYPPLVVALDLVSRRLLLTYQFYARRPRLVWKTLHALYRQAVAWHMDTVEVDAAKHSALSVYRAAVLTALADPSRLGPGELQRVRDYIARFGDEASISKAKTITQPINIFVLEGRRDRPGIALADQPEALQEGGAWVLATRRLVERSQFHLSQLQTGMSLRELGLPSDPDPARYRDLLQRLSSNWQGKRRPRAARQHFWPRAEIRVGFNSAWKLLNEIESESDRDMATVLRNEWTIRNESPGGFALRHINGTVAALNVGELIGVHMNGRSDSYVCIVRWIKSDNREHLEIGLQHVAPRLVPVSFRSDRVDDANAADAEPESEDQPIFFAPVSRNFNRVPVIIAPAQLVRPGLDFQIRYIGADIHLHSVRTLETTPYVEIVQVRPR
jgi:cyclic-di-GMP-binding protein